MIKAKTRQQFHEQRQTNSAQTEIKALGLIAVENTFHPNKYISSGEIRYKYKTKAAFGVWFGLVSILLAPN